MSKKITRIIALLLAFCMLSALAVFAAEPADEPLTDEQLIAEYHIPNTWARPALLFAVRNGILYGSGNGTLDPENTASRAELAAVFARLLPTERSAELSAFTDLDETKWYYEPIGQAAAMGLISGTGAATMSPDGTATREQAFVMLARAFALPDAERSYVYRFKDWMDVSEWAIPSVAAMIKAGYVSGSDGYLSPKKNITRQELAQALFEIIDVISAQVPEAQEGTVVSPTQTVAPGTVITGDLVVCNDAPQMELSNVTVTGRLVLQGVDPLQLTVSECSFGELVLCRPTQLLSDGTVKTVTVNEGLSVLSGTYTNVTVNADTEIKDTVWTVTMNAGNLLVDEGATVNNLTVSYTAAGDEITVNGTVKKLTVYAQISLIGSGIVKEAIACIDGFSPTLTPGTIEVSLAATLADMEVYCTMESTPCLENQWATADLTFGGAFPKGYCVFEWYLDGAYVGADSFIYPSATWTQRRRLHFVGDYFEAADHHLKVIVRFRDQVRTYNFTIPVESAYLSDISDVQTICVPSTAMCRTAIYRYSNRTGLICYIEEGTTVEMLEFLPPSTDRVKLADGTVGYCEDADIHISRDNLYTARKYTNAVKEKWINQNGYSSSTQYLIWCNLYTQEINIFKGSKGNWKLILASPCATGTNLNPTPKQVTKILYKSAQWDYDNYYVHHISVFDSERGFHSMLYRYDSYTLYSETMGRTASHGCVRVPDEGIMYIWNNVPVNSTVVIY